MTAVFRTMAAVVLFTAGASGLLAQGSWVQVPTALQSNPNTHVQIGGLWGIAMADSGTGFAAGYASVAGGFSGVLRKTPGNPTWFVLPASSFTLLPANHSLWSAVTVVGTHVWVCGSNGRLYKSTDNGNNWFSSANGIAGTNTLFDIHFRTPDEGMVVGSSGTIYFTTDGGANWVPQTLPATVPGNTDLYGVDDAGSGMGYWYVTGGTHTLIRGVPRSSATSWVDLSANVPSNIGIIEGLQFYNDNIGTIAGVIATGSPIHRTVNAGASFTSIGASLPSGTYNGLHFFDQTTGWVGSASPALYYTSNTGTSWTQATITPLPSQNITNWLTRITFVGTDAGYASGGAPGTSSTGWILKYVPAQAPDISSTPTSLDFGTFSCGTFIEKQFTISNIGAGPLNINAINFSHPEFALLAPLPTPVPPLGGATFSVRWTPTQPGPVPSGARMTILTNDPVNPAWDVDLAGIFNSGTVTIPSPATAPVACVNDSVDIVVNATLTGNIQPQLINFEHISGSTGVRLVSPPVGSNLSGSPTLTFRYAAASPGTWSGTYRILYGDPLCPKIAVIVFEGTANSSTLTASPSLVDFGEVCIGQFKDMLITLTNTGTVDAVVSSRTLIGGTDAFPNQHFSPFGPIPPSGNRQYTVRFAPGSGDLGLVEGTFKLRIDPCGDSVIIVLRGTGVKPAITFTPTNLLALGPVPIGQTTDEQVTITNSGTGSISIDAIALKPTHPRLTLTGLPALPAQLGPSQSIIVTARFSPDRIETIVSELSVRYSGPCSDSARLPVIASSASAPTILVQSTLDMGENACPDPLIDTLYVKNLGPGVLTMSRFTIGGRDASHFRVLAPGTPAFVAVGDSTPIYISCDAPAPGVSEGTLTIEHDDPKTFNSSVVQLRSERILIGWRVEGDSVSVMTSCAHVGVNRTFDLRNTGLRTRTIKMLRMLSGGEVFHIASNPLPMDVPPGSARPFEVTFTPSGQGNFSGILEVVIGPCNETMLLTLRGSGSESELTLAPTPVDFGSVNVGADVMRSVRLSNPGASVATVTEILFRPPMPVGSEHFTLSPPPSLPFALNSGASRDLDLRFSPQAMASYSGELCIIVSTPCPDTICVTLSGRGTSSGLGVSRTRLDYTLDPCTLLEKCDTVEVINNGSSPVRLTGAAFDDAGWFQLTFPTTFPLDVLPGSRLMFVVCAQSGFSGTRSSFLRIGTNDATTPELRVIVTAVRDSSGFATSERSFDFGAIASCQIGMTRTLSLSNTGLMMEIIDTLENNAPFFVEDALPIVLQPGQQKTVTVRFSPASFGVFRDTLFFTNSRCGKRIALELRGEYRADNISVTPDPLLFSNVPVGSSSIRNITFGNVHLAQVRVADVRIQPSGSFASSGAYPRTVSRGDTIALPIQFAPQSAGQHSATACIIIDQPCADTLCVTLQGSTSDGELLARPAVLHFGTVAQCAQTILQDTIRNISSADIRLLSSRIEGSGAAFFEILDPVTAEELLPPSGERIFTIRILPAAAADGSMDAQLVIENTGSPTLFAIPLAAQRVTLIAAAGGTVDFGSLFTGATESRRVTLRNNGTAPLRYSTLNATPGASIVPQPPFSIAPGDSLEVELLLTPSMSGQYLGSLRLDATSPCADSTVFLLTADVADGLAAGALDLGTRPSCLPAQGSVLVRNTQTVAAEIRQLTFTGSDAAAFHVLAPLSLPLTLAPGDSIEVLIEFAAIGGERGYGANLAVLFRTGSTDLIANAAVSAVAHSGRLSGPTVGDFASVEISAGGESRNFLFTNNAPFAVRIASATASGSVFTLLSSTPPLPATVQPGATVEFALRFAPAATVSYTGQLSLTYESPCPLVQDIPLRGDGIDTRRPVVLRLASLEGAPDDVVEIPLSIDRDLGGLVTEWSGEISLNASMLYPMEVTLAGTLSADMQAQFSYDQTSGIIRVAAAGAPLRSGSGVIAIVRCLVLIGDDTTSPLRIEPEFSFGRGARVERRDDGEFTLVDFCDADGLRLVRDRAGLRIVSSSPSPFTEALTITFDIDSDGPVDLRLYDAAGRESAVLLERGMEAGRHSITRRTPDIGAGTYFCVLRHNGRAVATRIIRAR
ncbi:MAG: choice-of-anchor D domain-containing protein [Bacteroidia bacterium]|nr:choice-of-anchor D domain-containing protein [Bacteroidia bacterium]